MPNPPVVFIPGLGGSFNLPVLLDWRGPTTGGWRFPPFVDYGDTFVETFLQAGYRRDRDLFVAFYDWRKSVRDIARDYLILWLDRALQRSRSDKVVLVAHSMGGLVARSYIQSNEYRGDVARLITLGTPHRGAATAYYTWGGGEIRWDSLARTVIDVYLWYLEHIHPFQSRLDRLRTIRTQVPGLRDLLPIDDYLLTRDSPPRTIAEDHMNQRNLWGDILNNPEGARTLVERVPVMTINGTGARTLEAITVDPPPPPVDNPPRYPDGTPAAEQSGTQGDGTVLVRSAQIDHERVRNLPPLNLTHAVLPDQLATRILAELNVPLPERPPVVGMEPRLVIMTASPLELTVDFPVEAPVLGVTEAAPLRRPPRRRRVRARNFGHRGKPLNMIVIPRPALGVYSVRLHGTSTGTFALGTMMVSGGAEGVLGAGAEAAMQQPVATPITTVSGEVAVETELYYQVRCTSTTEPPQVGFDAEATTRNALIRMHNAVQTVPPGVLGAAEGVAPADRVKDALAAMAAPDDLRERLGDALGAGDERAIQEMTDMLSRPERPPEVVRLLDYIAEHMIGGSDAKLALGLAEQLKQITEQS